jgi:hypothetical protein
LEIQSLVNAGLGKDVMASMRSHPETLRLKKLAELLETQVGV